MKFLRIFEDFERAMNDLMVSEFGGLNALKILNCDEEKRK